MEPFFREQFEVVNILNVFRARQIVGRILPKTSLTFYRRLSERIGAEVYVKHENHLPTHSFKVRGAVNFIEQCSEDQIKNGIVVATRGNHGLAVAWAAQRRGIFCNVVVPEKNDPLVNEMILSYDAQLIEHGSDFYEAQDYAEELSENAGYYYLRQGNEPLLITGIATMGLEIMEDLPNVEVIVMPIGGGTGCASVSMVIKQINPSVEIYGVQAARIPAFYESWKQGKKVTVSPAETVASGLAARSVFDLPFIILKDLITDVVLLSEEELIDGVRLAISYTQNLAEVAGAAAIKAAFALRERIRGKRVVLIMTGGNISIPVLASILCR
ncbi:MAG: pyridoxal-phosphate dependent enzyme [Syntrophobacterales bacterium]|nr:pyridoxal-phosphate dependent enzyme [Syntrophobacterales bacterium]